MELNEREDGVTQRAGQLRGFIDERHFELAEVEFPGITQFYRNCLPRPGTFLELVARYGAFEPLAA